MNTYKVKITSKRQVTFPRQVLEELHLKPGDVMEINETGIGYMLKPRTVDLTKLKTLLPEIDVNTPPFDLKHFRETAHDLHLRVSF